MEEVLCPQASSGFTKPAELSFASLFRMREKRGACLSAPQGSVSQQWLPFLLEVTNQAPLTLSPKNPPNQPCCEDITNSQMLLVLSDHVRFFIFLFRPSHNRKKTITNKQVNREKEINSHAGNTGWEHRAPSQQAEKGRDQDAFSGSYKYANILCSHKLRNSPFISLLLFVLSSTHSSNNYWDLLHWKSPINVTLVVVKL